MVGTSGGELGIRGYIAAFDVADGKRLEDVHGPGRASQGTTPGPERPGRGRRVGLAHRALDPALGLSSGGRERGRRGWDMRPATPLLNRRDRARRRHGARSAGITSITGIDSWDWDEVSTPLLIDFPKDGRTVKGLVHPGRNAISGGWSGARQHQVSWTRAVRTQEVFTKIDPVTGRPELQRGAQAALGRLGDFLPRLWGGKDWTPAGYNPKTQYLYIRPREPLAARWWNIEARPYEPGKPYLGIDFVEATMSQRQARATSASWQAGTWRPARRCGAGSSSKELGPDPHDRWRARLPGGTKRSELPSVRRQVGRHPLGVNLRILAVRDVSSRACIVASSPRLAASDAADQARARHRYPGRGRPRGRSPDFGVDARKFRSFVPPGRRARHRS